MQGPLQLWFSTAQHALVPPHGCMQMPTNTVACLALPGNVQSSPLHQFWPRVCTQGKDEATHDRTGMKKDVSMQHAKLSAANTM